MPHRSAQPDGVDRARPEWFAAQSDGVDRARPEWFAAFLADRGTRKPSAHTLKAYRQDFDAIATLIAGGEDLSGMPLSAIMIETMRTAFAQYAETHEAASIQRCWSTWNVLCTYLYTAELTPVRRSGYFAVGGWTGRPGMVGSVLVGAYDRAGNFIYCGRIMSGFSDRIRRDLAIRLSEIGCVTAPFQPPPVDRDRVHWVTPLLVGRVEYREYTSQPRHAAWKGIAPVDPASAHLPIPL